MGRTPYFETLHDQRSMQECRTCGKLDHISSICPESKPHAQIHAKLAVDDASVASDEESIIILT